ncbi:UNVERIFIED_CONTAM: hypothetical protein RMT77_015380 [Armadillidium vulgare]
MLNSPKITFWHWLSLLTWIILLSVILFFLLNGPGKHEAFDKFSTGIVLTFGGLTVAGTFCICCYMGFDGFKGICFRTKLDEDDNELRENQFRQENIQRRVTEMQETEEIEDLDSEKNCTTEQPELKESLSLDSKVYRKFSTNPDDGPFTVEKNSRGSLEVVAHKLSRVDSMSYQREYLFPKKKRQKRSLNWYEEENNARNMSAPHATEIGKRIQTAKVPHSARLSYRDIHSSPEKKKNFSQSLSDIPEPFEYKTPEKKNGNGSNYQRL